MQPWKKTTRCRPRCLETRHGRGALASALTLTLTAWLGGAGALAAQVRINEVVASNLNGITDEDGDTPDWIELRNDGPAAVDLSGYGLSDDPGDPLKWTLPAGALLPAGSHVVVYASGKDRQGPPHTNFKLSASGETVVLAEPSGVIVDQLDAGQLWIDVSRGLGPADELLYFDTPTPNAANTELGRASFTPAVSFEPAGGLYDGPVAVTIPDAPFGASLYYSLDGSEPTVESDPWPGALVLAEPSNVLRVRAFRDGEWPSQISSVSYFVDEDPTPNLDVLSMIIDPDDLYGPDGIYDGSNLFADLEQPMHVELFEADGSGGFASPGGARLHGFGSRFNAMKSFRFILRGGYGANELSYPIFDDRPVTEFKRLIFRAHGQDFRNANMRDPYVQELAEGEDLDTQGYRPVISFVNGEYWGVYNIRERHDEFYGASRSGTEDVDLLERNATPVEGDASHYNAMLDFIRDNDLRIEENYEYVQTQMDTAEHQTYFAVEIFSGNTDWPTNNIKFWRPRTPDGRWRWMIYDTEFGFGLFGSPSSDSVGRLLNGGVQEWATELFQGLLQSPTYRNSFLNRFADYLNTRFGPEESGDLLRRMATRIGPEMPFHQARWDDDIDRWIDNIQEMGDWTNRRAGFVRGDLVENFELPGTFDLTLDVAPPGAGSIRLTALTVDSAFTGEYFLGVPVSLTAEPAPGWEFAAWTDANLPQEAAIELLATGDTELGALFQPAGPTGDAVIHEINYNSEVAFDAGDWVEIHNPGAADLDLSGWRLGDDNPGNSFTFPAGTVLPAGGYLVAAADVAAFEALFPGVAPVFGDLGFNFGAGGDEVRLITPEGDEYDVVAYDDAAPWPTEPDGQGPTLELLDPALDNSLPESWTASTAPNGTPGGPNG